MNRNTYPHSGIAPNDEEYSGYPNSFLYENGLPLDEKTLRTILNEWNI